MTLPESVLLDSCLNSLPYCTWDFSVLIPSFILLFPIFTYQDFHTYIYSLVSHAHTRACTHTRISVIPALFHQLGSTFLAVNLYVLSTVSLSILLI